VVKTHTKLCKKNFDLWDANARKYGYDWPNYCRVCGGWGGTYSAYDPSPSGVSLSPGHMWEAEPCPECMDKFKCPRCAGQLEDKDFDNDTCPHCGLDFKEGDGIPQPPGCICPALSILDEEKGSA